MEAVKLKQRNTGRKVKKQKKKISENTVILSTGTDMNKKAAVTNSGLLRGNLIARDGALPILSSGIKRLTA